MEMNEIYKQLTSVDIEQQKIIWDERGKGYYGEYLLFKKLYKSIYGMCKLIMNLNVPTTNSKTTEIDMVMIHESGLYVFEIKHYKGTIYGKDTDKTWTQYFRTAKNNTFKNPMEQNAYHVQALKNLLPNIPMFSIVVFTNDDCDIRVNNTNPDVGVCTLNNVDLILDNQFSKNKDILSPEEINDIFNKISVYSQMSEPIVIEGNEASFFSWVEPAIKSLEENKEELNREKIKIKQNRKKGLFVNIGIFLAIALLSIIIISGFQNNYEKSLQKNTAELESFKQNFLHIDEIDNEYIDDLDSYVKVSNVKISPLTDDAVSFSASLTRLNDVYNIVVCEDAKYIVMTKSGKVFEYDLFGESLKYNQWKNILGKHYNQSIRLAPTQFYGITNPKEITYIKIKNIQLTKTDIGTTLIKDNLEIELYSE